MNTFNIINKLQNNKWMMERKSLYSFYNTIDNLANIRMGGLKGLIMGESPIVKMQDDFISKITPENSDTNNVGILYISGVLTKGATELEKSLLGLTDTDDIFMSLDEYAVDPSIDSIILCFSSPGGETTGIAELGRKIKYIDENVKPVFSWTETMCCSAAYWLGSQARTIGMTETSQLGSIGVYMIILNAEEKYKQEGIEVQAISSGKYKMMGHDHESLKSDEKDLLQADVESQHQKFKDVIKSKRPQAKDEAMEGISYEGPKALELGLVDLVVEDFDEFLSKV